MPQCYKKKSRTRVDETAKAFTIAKEALGYVAKFRTPPTPNIYEVWYRYAEGDSLPLTEQLSYAVNDAQAANCELLEQLHKQFLSESDNSELSNQLGEQLLGTIGDVESIISTQLSAHDGFSAAVSTASDRVDVENMTAEALRACVESVLLSNEQMQSQLADLSKRLGDSKDQVHQLRASFVESQKEMMMDPLTGIGNRRLFDSLIQNATEHHERLRQHFFLLLIDLDHFKDVNDTYGHSTGDRVLKFVAANIERLSADASVARYGGDEFAVFINTDDVNDGVEFGEAICQFFAKNKLTVLETGEYLGQLTTSIGGARLRKEDTASSWFDRADQLLYSSKNAGRNRVMIERKIK